MEQTLPVQTVDDKGLCTLQVKAIQKVTKMHPIVLGEVMLVLIINDHAQPELRSCLVALV